MYHGNDLEDDGERERVVVHMWNTRQIPFETCHDLSRRLRHGDAQVEAAISLAVWKRISWKLKTYVTYELCLHTFFYCPTL